MNIADSRRYDGDIGSHEKLFIGAEGKILIHLLGLKLIYSYLCTREIGNNKTYSSLDAIGCVCANAGFLIAPCP